MCDLTTKVANLNDFNFQDEISTSGAPFMTTASPAPIKEEPIVEPEKISTPRDPTPEPEPIKMPEAAPPSPPKPEKSADALLDEMLFGSKVEEKKGTDLTNQNSEFLTNEKPEFLRQKSFSKGITQKLARSRSKLAFHSLNF